jgi:hypothetical protein
MNILGILNRNKRKQDCLLLTEDGRVLEIAPAVVRGYVHERKTQEAWELYPDLRIPKRETNRLFQVITERDMAPLSLDGTNDKKHAKRAQKGLSEIAQESVAEARANLQKNSLKSKSAETIQLLALILGVTVGILALVGLFMSGKLSIGGEGDGSIFSSALPAILGFLAPKGRALKDKTKGPQNTLVLDPVKGYGLEHVDEPRGNRWNYKGKSVFLMKRIYKGDGSGEGVLEPFELPKDMGDSPRKLFRALIWDREVAILFSLQNPLLEKFKVIGMYVLIGILLLMIYLIFSSVMG